MATQCPKCNSEYIDVIQEYVSANGRLTEMKCINCGFTWRIIDPWNDFPNGEWLMSFDTSNDWMNAKFFRMNNGEIAMWLYFQGVHKDDKNTEVVYGKHSFVVERNINDDERESYCLVFYPPKNSSVIRNGGLHVSGIEFNSELTKCALQNKAIRVLDTYQGIQNIRFVINTNNRKVLDDIALWLRSITQADATKIYYSEGCYIATSVYGSYDCPEVWTLRRFRDFNLSETLMGRGFIRIYYSLSPIIVRIFGREKWFSFLSRLILDRIVIILNQKGYSSDPYTDRHI